METKEQVIKDFEDCMAFQKSVGEDTRGVENDLKNNLWHYENKDYYLCTKCKRPETANYSNNEAMVERQLCFGCNLWEKRLEEDFTKGNVFVYNRTMYSVGTYGFSKGKYLGHGGAVFKITYPNGREAASNNVWCGGDLPFWLTEGFKTATMKRVVNMNDMNEVKHLL